MRVDDFLSRLEGVRRTGPGRWMAKCCFHEDRSPSLSVGEGDDGRILIKCFAGCPPNEILGAVGLTLNDLFPEPIPGDQHKPLRRPFPAADVLEALSNESRIVALAAIDIQQGKAVDKGRLLKAQERIEAGRRLANG